MLNLKIVKHNNTDVMSSLDLAEMCVGTSKDSHSDFMKKAKKVLGEGIGKFSDTYVHPQNKQDYACLMLPEREACLMAMSYSYELQAKVYDAWKALTPSPKTLMVSRAEELVCLREMGIFDNDEVVAILSEEFPILKPRTTPVLTYNSEMQCPVVRFLNERMTMRAGLNITSHDLFWAINDHYDFFTSQAKITRIVKLLHLEGVEYGQIRTKDKGYQRGFKGLGLL